MPNYVFEAKDGRRVEQFHKLEERPDVVTLDGVEYRPIITEVNVVGISESTRDKTPEELLDENINQFMKDLEATQPSQYLDGLDVNKREVKRMLDHGPLAPEDPFKDEKEAEEEAAAIKEGLIEPPEPDEPDPDKNWMNAPANSPMPVAPQLSGKKPSKNEMKKMETRLKEVGVLT